MTTRGAVESDFARIVEFLDRGVEIARAVDSKVEGRKLKDFKEYLGEGENVAELQGLKKEVVEFARALPTVGFEVDE